MKKNLKKKNPRSKSGSERVNSYSNPTLGSLRFRRRPNSIQRPCLLLNLPHFFCSLRLFFFSFFVFFLYQQRFQWPLLPLLTIEATTTTTATTGTRSVAEIFTPFALNPSPKRARTLKFPPLLAISGPAPPTLTHRRRARSPSPNSLSARSAPPLSMFLRNRPRCLRHRS